MMKELMKCPFCGGEAKLIKSVDRYRTNPTAIIHQFQVICTNGCCIMPSYESFIFQDESGEVVIKENGAEKAIEAWNKRYYGEQVEAAPVYKE